MKLIENYKDLPLDKLYDISCPNQEAFDELQGKEIFESIADICTTEEEFEKAVSGAFIGWHIVNHLICGAEDKEVGYNMLVEMLGTYDCYDKDIKGACWNTLKITLESFGFGEFYNKGIDYIIENNGELD